MTKNDNQATRVLPAAIRPGGTQAATRHLYDKLSVHRRHEAVEQARVPGLLAPPPRGR